MRIAGTLTVVALVAVLSGCDDRSATLPLPTMPSAALPVPSPPAAPVPPGFGTIHTSVTITAMTPASGSTLSVRDCPPQAGTQTILCTDQLRTAISVLNEGQDRAARLRVVFSDGTRECASAWLPDALFVTATPTAFNTSTVFLSWEASEGVGSPVSVIQPCQLPVTTSRIVLEMWEKGNSRTPAAAQEFDGSYTFVR